jgi:bacteriocin-like protein
MEQIMSKTYDAITSEQVLEPSRELTKNELAQVSGGIIAVLIGFTNFTPSISLTPSIPIPPPQPGFMPWSG